MGAPSSICHLGLTGCYMSLAPANEMAVSRTPPLGVIAFARAPAGALTEALLERAAAAVDQLERDASIERIVLTGTDDSFLVGVDLGFFSACLQAGDIERVLRFTRRCRQLLGQIERGPKQTIAWTRGPAYGGGLELALACDRIVAAPGAKFAFPETGVGIYPGMGGTQRLARRIGVGLAKWMIGSGAIVPAEQALEIGLIDAICADINSVDAALATSGAGPPALSPRFAALAQLFGEHSLTSLFDPAFPQPADPQLVRSLIQLRSKAPLAVRAADALIERGARLRLTEGLDLEYAGLAAIFASHDALAGVTAAPGTRVRFLGQ
jgi:enoyl-CoA hydratase/3-hydroxyacyl-CoA dehydrogenase